MDPELYKIPGPEPNPLSPLYENLNDTMQDWKDKDKSLRTPAGSNTVAEEGNLI